MSSSLTFQRNDDDNNCRQNIENSGDSSSEVDEEEEEPENYKTTENRVDYNEKLIRIVYEQKPLWNIQLKRGQKQTKQVEDMWEEVAKLMGAPSGAFIKKNWKNLVDTHRSYLNKEKKTTGKF